LTDSREVEDEHGRIRLVLGECYSVIRAASEHHGVRLWGRARQAEACV
jgi:hypothetical protein